MIDEQGEQVTALGFATALALSRRAHETVEAVGIPDLVEQWRDVIDVGKLTERVAARLISLGAVYPSSGLIWATARRPDLATRSDQLVEIVVDDPAAVAGHEIRLSGTVAETLGLLPTQVVDTRRSRMAHREFET